MKSLFAALCTGILASLFLFWLMQVMIMPEHKTIKKTVSLNRVDFVRLKREQPPKEKPQPPEKPKQPESVQPAKKPQPPKKIQTPVKAKPKIQPQKVVQKPLPDLDMPKLDLAAPVKDVPDVKFNSAPDSANKSVTTSPKAHEADPGGTVNSGVIALVRIPPQYPKRAMRRGIQGWVKIEFTITTVGTVKDAIVVEAKPNHIFDDAALNAINKWKFKEKIVNGSAVEQRAVQILQFKLK